MHSSGAPENPLLPTSYFAFDISHRNLYQCVVLVMVNIHQPSDPFRPQAQAQAQKVSAAAASRRSINQKCKVALRVSPAVYLDDEG